MKTVIVIGANGNMGKAALTGLRKHRVITASRSGEGYDFKVDITNRESIKNLFEKVGNFDAVVNTVGYLEYADFVDMTEAQWDTTIQSKMIGQINLVNIGWQYVNQGGSFTLISGVLNVKPIPMAIADATTSDVIDNFVQCVAHELPGDIRINVINPTI